MSTSSDLVVYSVTAAEIEAKRAEYAALSCDTSKGYEEVRLAIASVREARVAVEKRRVELKADALAYGRLVDSRAKELTSLLVEIEEPLKAKKQAVDDEKARVRAEAEAAKLAAIEAEIRAKREQEESQLRAAREVEEKRLAEERAALEAERAKLAESQAALEAARKAEADRIEAAARAERERVEAERVAEEARLAEARRAEEERQRAERERIAAERAAEEAKLAEARRAEEERLAAERENLAAERRAEEERQLAARLAIEAERRAVAAEREAQERAELERQAKARAEQEAAERERREAELRPDLDKVAAFAKKIRALKAPVLVDITLAENLDTALDRLEKVALYLDSLAVVALPAEEARAA